MSAALLRSTLVALIVIALVGVPVLALRASNPLVAPLANTLQAGGAEPDGTEDGRGKCHGIQNAYWHVTGNRGAVQGHGRGAEALARVAAERGCELAAGTPPDANGKAKPQGKDNGAGNEGTEDKDKAKPEGKGPAWAREGDGPPWGLAWGHWLKADGKQKADGRNVCRRIADRMAAHPNAVPPADVGARITEKLGCDLSN